MPKSVVLPFNSMKDKCIGALITLKSKYSFLIIARLLCSRILLTVT